MADFGVLFSKQFNVPPEWMSKMGLFDPTLDVDSPLFIDPFLLSYSKHPEFSACASEVYEAHFTEIHRLLSLSQSVGDKAWKGALKKFQFRETKGLGGTCLGYSKRSTKGHAFGPKLTARALEWARQVIALGVKDPELFSSMSLFEEGIGADLISDMVTNICLKCIIDFNERMYVAMEADLGIRLARQPITLRDLTAPFPVNPHSNRGDPIILLPADVLKHLPIANNAKAILEVAEKNAALRDRVNSHISEIFKIRTKEDKEATKKRAMESAAAFQTLLDLLKLLESKPYNINKDPEGLIQWSSIAHATVAVHKLTLRDDPAQSRLDRIELVAQQIIVQFQSLVEDNRLWRVFHVDGKPRHERFAQLLFFAIAKSYCAANDLDISPESDRGAGPVDFKFSQGVDNVLVEIKLSTNQKIVDGYSKQLVAYQNAEQSKRSHYVVIDVGKMGDKWKKVQEAAKQNPAGAKRAQLHLIDGNPRPAASHL